MKLDNNGNILHAITVGSNPQGVAIDQSGNIWVANYDDSTVTKISPSTTLAPTTDSPTAPTGSPTTKSPTTKAPTISPTTVSPTKKPTKSPTNLPTKKPTRLPTISPTKKPTKLPTTRPTSKPLIYPTTGIPSKSPSVSPTNSPTISPTIIPEFVPALNASSFIIPIIIGALCVCGFIIFAIRRRHTDKGLYNFAYTVFDSSSTALDDGFPILSLKIFHFLNTGGILFGFLYPLSVLGISILPTQPFLIVHSEAPWIFYLTVLYGIFTIVAGVMRYRAVKQLRRGSLTFYLVSASLPLIGVGVGVMAIILVFTNDLFISSYEAESIYNACCGNGNIQSSIVPNSVCIALSSTPVSSTHNEMLVGPALNGGCGGGNVGQFSQEIAVYMSPFFILLFSFTCIILLSEIILFPTTIVMLNSEKKKPIFSQTLEGGKSSHIFFINSSTFQKVATTIKSDLVRYGVTIARSKPMEEGVDSAMCIVLLLDENIFLDPLVLATLRYIGMTKKERIGVILVQTTSGSFLSKAPPDLQELVSNFDRPLSMLNMENTVERDAHIQGLCIRIQTICSREYSSSFIAFLSHFKKEAGPPARLIQEHLEARCNERESEKPKLLRNATAFLDSERLADLGKLLDDLRRSKVVVVLLSKGYFTRPWCLAELYAAFESNIPIITMNIVGGGYDRDATVRFLSIFSPKTLDEANPDASMVLQKLGIDVTELGRKLSAVIPQIIEINFNPNGTKHQIDAGVDDLIDRILLHAATPFVYKFAGSTGSSAAQGSTTSVVIPFNDNTEYAIPTAIAVEINEPLIPEQTEKD
jgi:hypothetical protein